MKIKNISSQNLYFLDILSPGSAGGALILQPDAEVVIFDEDAEKSNLLKKYMDDGLVSKLSDDEPNDDESNADSPIIELSAGFSGTSVIPGGTGGLTQVINEDGTLTIGANLSNGELDFTSSIPYNILGSKFELKARFTSGVGTEAYMTIIIGDDAQTMNAILSSYAIDEENPYRIRVSPSASPGDEFVLENFDLDEYHTFTLEILPDNEGKNVYLDGTLIGSDSSDVDGSRNIHVHLLMLPGAVLDIDYMKWTGA